MEYNFLGNTGLKVSRVGFGTFIFGVQVNEEVGIKLVKKAFESGINFFDTAEVYGNGKSEEILGKALKNLGIRRSGFVVSTKLFWSPVGKDGKRYVNECGLSRKHIIEGLKGSLERLDLEYVDVVFCHRPDIHTPMEEIVRAFDYVINKGMALYWGTSEWSAAQITKAIISHRLGLISPVVEQPQYNSIHRRKVEKDFVDLYESDKLGLTTWSPLSSGVLSGKYMDGIPKGSRLDLPGMENLLNGMVLKDTQFKSLEALNNSLKELKKVSDRLECSLSVLNLAWVLKNKNVNVMLLGANKMEQLEENLKCLEILPKLNDDVMKEIDEMLKTKPEGIMDFRKFRE